MAVLVWRLGMALIRRPFDSAPRENYSHLSPGYLSARIIREGETRSVASMLDPPLPAAGRGTPWEGLYL